MKIHPVAPLLALLCAACQSAAPVKQDNAVAAGMADYTFVFLETGPNQSLSEEAKSDAFAGHFENMARLADASLLASSERL